MENLSARTVGLFGTCGGSQWRNPFISLYEKLGMPYFNPQVDNWTPELGVVEAWHLANDSLILFPITNETLASGSLAETGFSALTAVRTNENRFVVMYIDPTVDDALTAQNPVGAKDSVRARKLVSDHLKQNPVANVFVVESLEEMLQVSIKLFGALELISSVRDPNKNWRAKLSPETWLELVTAKNTSTEETQEVQANSSHVTA